MKTYRLTRSTIVLNVPGTGPLGLLRVCHAEGEDPVARLRSVLAGLPPVGHRAAPPREARSVNWSQVMSVIKSTDWSAHQMRIEHVENWDVLPIEAAIE